MTMYPNAKQNIGGREQKSQPPLLWIDRTMKKKKRSNTEFSREHQPVMDCLCHSPFLPARMAESGSEVAGKAEMIAGFH